MNQISIKEEKYERKLSIAAYAAQVALTQRNGQHVKVPKFAQRKIKQYKKLLKRRAKKGYGSGL